MFSLLVIPPNPSSFGKVETWPKWHIFLFNPIRQWAHFLILEHVGTFGNESVFQIAFRRRRRGNSWISGRCESIQDARAGPFQMNSSRPSNQGYKFTFKSCLQLWCIQCHIFDTILDATQKPNFWMHIRYPQLEGRGLKIKEWTDSI